MKIRFQFFPFLMFQQTDNETKTTKDETTAIKQTQRL